MSNKRKREYARRRYEKYVQRQEQRAVQTARRKRQAAVAGAAGGVVAVLALAAVVVVPRVLPDDTGTASAEASAAATTAAATDVQQCERTAPQARTDAPTFDAVPAATAGHYTVTLATNCGDVVVDLDADAAPQAVGSLVALAQAGYFDATPCHRLTTTGIYVLQCGDPTGTGQGGPGYSFGPLENTPTDDVYPAGTIAMARVGGDGSSMGSQFFIVYADSTIPSDDAGGYTVMGTVTSGLDVVTTIAAAGTQSGSEAPAMSVGIESVTVEEAS